MKQLGKIMLLALGLGIFAAALGQFHPGTSRAAGSAAVTVVNTPLPVDVGGTDAQTAFVASEFCGFGGPPDNVADVCEIEPLYTVPMGKTAVIESASGVCVTNSGTATREFQLRFTGPGGPAQLSFPPSPAVPAVGSSTANVKIDVSTTAQNLRSYASGGASGTPVNFFGFASANQTGGFPNCAFTVSGHVVSTQ